jgi:hypothetical protein
MLNNGRNVDIFAIDFFAIGGIMRGFGKKPLAISLWPFAFGCWLFKP